MGFKERTSKGVERKTFALEKKLVGQLFKEEKSHEVERKREVMFKAAPGVEGPSILVP